MQDEPLTSSLSDLVHTRRGAATISFAVLSLAAMAVFVYIEVSRVAPSARHSRQETCQEFQPVSSTVDCSSRRRLHVQHDGVTRSAAHRSSARWSSTASRRGSASGTRWICSRTASRLRSRSCTLAACNSIRWRSACCSPRRSCCCSGRCAVPAVIPCGSPDATQIAAVLTLPPPYVAHSAATRAAYRSCLIA